MSKYSRAISYAAVLVCLTPLSGVYTLIQTFPWVADNSASAHIQYDILGESSSSASASLQSSPLETCVVSSLYHLMADGSHQCSSQDLIIRYHASSLLDIPIDTSYRNGQNTTNHLPNMAYQADLQPGYRSLHPREHAELDPLMFHVRNNEYYNHFRKNHVFLLSWTLSLLLGLLIPVLALLYDAYLRITSKSRQQQQLQAIQKALKPYKRKVLTKSQAKETCPICLAQFAMGEFYCASSCSHCFHQSCMVQWLLQQTKHQPNHLVETILSNEPAMSTLRRQCPSELKAPCPCCRQAFVTVPLVR